MVAYNYIACLLKCNSLTAACCHLFFSFICEHENHGDDNERARWVMKSPFSGNCLHFHHTVGNSFEAVRYLTKTVLPGMYDNGRCYELPYLLFQKRLKKNTEAKLCFVNREFCYFCSGMIYIRMLRCCMQLISFYKFVYIIYLQGRVAIAAATLKALVKNLIPMRL